MYGGYGGLGAPGTRVTKRLGEGTELWTYVKQAAVGSLAINVALALVMFAGPVFLSSWTLPIATLLCPLCVYALRKARVNGRRVLGPNITGLLVWGVWPLLLVTALENRVRWWAWLTLDGAVGRALASIWAQLRLPLWGWAVLVALGALLALRGLLRWYLGLVAAGFVLWTVYHIGPADLRPFIVAWDRLRWLGVFFLPAPFSFALLLAFVMAKEELIPNLEITAVPASWEELRQATFGELAWPGWHPREPEPEPQGTTIIVEGETVAGRAQQLRGELPEPTAGLGVRVLWFREVMGRTKGMVRTDAVACGYTRPEWERTIEVLLALKAIKMRSDGKSYEPNATGKRILTRTIAQDSATPPPLP